MLNRWTVGYLNHDFKNKGFKERGSQINFTDCFDYYFYPVFDSQF